MKYVIEFEGFSLPRSFVFKEIAILGIDNHESNHFFVKPPKKFEKLSDMEKRIVRYCESNMHQVYWFAGRDKFSNVLNYLSEILVDGSIVYTKGLQKQRILQKLMYPCQVIDVESFSPESLYTREGLEGLITTCQPCKLSFHKENLHCAHVKAILLKDIIFHYENEQLHPSEPEVSQEDCDMRWNEEEKNH